MKPITAHAHGVLDYVMVVLFLAAPTLFGLAGIAATISYVLALIHLLLTAITAFPLGAFRIVPFKVHGALELLVGVLLVALPWLLGFSGETASRNFYVTVGLVILVVALLTHFQGADVARADG